MREARCKDFVIKTREGELPKGFFQGTLEFVWLTACLLWGCTVAACTKSCDEFSKLHKIHQRSRCWNISALK